MNPVSAAPPTAAASTPARYTPAALVERVYWFVIGRCRTVGPAFGLDPDDLAQDVFLKLTKWAGWYDPARVTPTTFAGMVIGSVVGWRMQPRRRRAKAGFVVLQGSVPVGAGETNGIDLAADPLGVDPSDAAAERELIERLPEAVRMLPRKEREAVRRVFGLGRRKAVKQAVIAAAEGVTREAVSARKVKALVKLRAMLDTTGEG